tara:strand:- start:207 stop:359 length:153 start_codon:yes stop_codon:yes gene_type:complete
MAQIHPMRHPARRPWRIESKKVYILQPFSSRQAATNVPKLTPITLRTRMH